MIALHWETEIRARAERVFALLAELRDYDRWLPNSSAFRGTGSISAGPIGVGTTYVEPGPLGVRHGRVTEFVPPTRLAFEQPMTLRPNAMGVLGIRLFMNLMLLRGGYPPAIIHSTERQRYYDALKGSSATMHAIVQDAMENSLASIEKLLDLYDTKPRR